MTATDNPNIPDENGETPIHVAAKEGHLDILELLLTKTNNVNDLKAQDNEGKTPLHHAAENGHHEIVKILIASIENQNVPKPDELMIVLRCDLMSFCVILNF